jgi:acyl dehydratase
MMLLHGEHRIDFYRPIAVGSKLKSVAVLTNVADKGKGALLNLELRTYEIGPKSE